MKDIRDIIFKKIIDKKFKALLIPERSGCLSGVQQAMKQAADIGVDLNLYIGEGDLIEKGKAIGVINATPKNMAIAEEKIIGALSKFSGIATAAKVAVDQAEGKVEIVAGSWKKMPPEIKDGVRIAVTAGGAFFRITNNDMIYLDKNYITMFGSISETLNAVKDFSDYTKVIQIKGKRSSIEDETRQALEYGCNLLMVDTGNIEDLTKCLNIVNELGVRDKIEIAFAGGIKIEAIKELTNYDIDKVCIGKEIVDALLLDIRLDVI